MLGIEKFVDESDFQKEGNWYILSKNSQFEVCSLAGIPDFGEDIVSEAGSDSGGIYSHDGSKNDTDSDYNTEPSIISAISSTEKSFSYTLRLKINGGGRLFFRDFWSPRSLF